LLLPPKAIFFLCTGALAVVVAVALPLLLLLLRRRRLLDPIRELLPLLLGPVVILCEIVGSTNQPPQRRTPAHTHAPAVGPLDRVDGLELDLSKLPLRQPVHQEEGPVPPRHAHDPPQLLQPLLRLARPRLRGCLLYICM